MWSHRCRVAEYLAERRMDFAENVNVGCGPFSDVVAASRVELNAKAVSLLPGEAGSVRPRRPPSSTAEMRRGGSRDAGRTSLFPRSLAVHE
jgi:hypothetical protein